MRVLNYAQAIREAHATGCVSLYLRFRSARQAGSARSRAFFASSPISDAAPSSSLARNTTRFASSAVWLTKTPDGDIFVFPGNLLGSWHPAACAKWAAGSNVGTSAHVRLPGQHSCAVCSQPGLERVKWPVNPPRIRNKLKSGPGLVVSPHISWRLLCPTFHL